MFRHARLVLVVGSFLAALLLTATRAEGHDRNPRQPNHAGAHRHSTRSRTHGFATSRHFRPHYFYGRRYYIPPRRFYPGTYYFRPYYRFRYVAPYIRYGYYRPFYSYYYRPYYYEYYGPYLAPYPYFGPTYGFSYFAWPYPNFGYYWRW